MTTSPIIGDKSKLEPKRLSEPLVRSPAEFSGDSELASKLPPQLQPHSKAPSQRKLAKLLDKRLKSNQHAAVASPSDPSTMRPTDSHTMERTGMGNRSRGRKNAGTQENRSRAAIFNDDYHK